MHLLYVRRGAFLAWIMFELNRRVYQTPALFVKAFREVLERAAGKERAAILVSLMDPWNSTSPDDALILHKLAGSICTLWAVWIFVVFRKFFVSGQAPDAGCGNGSTPVSMMQWESSHALKKEILGERGAAMVSAVQAYDILSTRDDVVATSASASVSAAPAVHDEDGVNNARGSAAQSGPLPLAGAENGPSVEIHVSIPSGINSSLAALFGFLQRELGMQIVKRQDCGGVQAWNDVFLLLCLQQKETFGGGATGCESLTARIIRSWDMKAAPLTRQERELGMESPPCPSSSSCSPPADTVRGIEAFIREGNEFYKRMDKTNGPSVNSPSDLNAEGGGGGGLGKVSYDPETERGLFDEFETEFNTFKHILMHVARIASGTTLLGTNCFHKPIRVFVDGCVQKYQEHEDDSTRPCKKCKF